MTTVTEITSNASRPNADTKATLKRGEACAYCRRRKMRCDGTRPTCGQCMKSNRREDCEYGNGPSQAQKLEEEIRTLEEKLKKLTPNENNDNGGPAPVRMAATPARVSSLAPGWAALDEPPIGTRQSLIDLFLAHSDSFSVFLSPSKLRSSALLPLPLGHHSRSTPFLTTTMYLCAMIISRYPPFKAQVQTFYKRAVKLREDALKGQHPDQVMHTIQGEVLLSRCMTAHGMLVDAKAHSCAALALNSSVNLHKIRSADATRQCKLPPPKDSVEEGERILAFWYCYENDMCLSIMRDARFNIQEDKKFGDQADTCWPWTLDEYAKGTLPRDFRSTHTVLDFRSGTGHQPSADDSIETRIAKATIAWYMAHELSLLVRSELNEAQIAHSKEAFERIDQLTKQLVSVYLSGPTVTIQNRANPAETKETRLQTLTQASLITLHSTQTSAASARICVDSATAVFQLAAELKGGAFVDPHIGTVWSLASVILDKEAKAVSGSERDKIVETMRRGIEGMEKYEGCCPILGEQVGSVRVAFLNLM